MVLSFILNNAPIYREPNLAFGFYLTPMVILVSWALIRMKKELVSLALVTPVLSGLAILGPGFWADSDDGLKRQYGWDQMSTSEFAQFGFSVFIQLCAIAVFYLNRKEKPNQPPEPTRAIVRSVDQSRRPRGSA